MEINDYQQQQQHQVESLLGGVPPPPRSLPSHVLQSAKLNNRATDLYWQGNYAQAIHRWTAALELARLPSTCANEERLVEDGDILVLSSTKSCMFPQQQKAFQQYRGPDDDDESFLIYQRPLRLTLEEIQGPPDQVFTTVSFVIMFNLALAHHLQAIHGMDGDSTKKLKSAVKLYELTFQLQSQHVPHALVTSAILNNLALAHKQLEQVEKFQACSEMLVSAVLLLVDLHLVNNTDDNSSVVMDGFLANVLHLLLPEPLSAAAA